MDPLRHQRANLTRLFQLFQYALKSVVPAMSLDVNPFGHFLSSSHTHRCPVMSLTDAELRMHMEPQNLGF